MASDKQLNSKANQDKKPMRVFKKKLRKYLYITLTFFFLIVAAYVYWSYFFTYSEGSRVGTLMKFSHKGNIFKTYEGEIILSSAQSNNIVALNSEKLFFTFSVVDKTVVSQLENLEGKNVVVYYKQKNQAVSWRGESTYIVYSVKVRE